MKPCQSNCTASLRLVFVPVAEDRNHKTTHYSINRALLIQDFYLSYLMGVLGLPSGACLSEGHYITARRESHQ